MYKTLYVMNSMALIWYVIVMERHMLKFVLMVVKIY